MDKQTPPCLLGVDGGGTSCRVAMLRDGQRFEVLLGPANVATDRAGAIARVRGGMVQVAQQAGLSAGVFGDCVAHVGLAGILSEDEARAIAGEIGLARVQVTDDQVTSVAGALGDGTGAVAGIGTGSFLVRQHAGKLRFVGGWGLILGDEASGAWLGRSALAAVLHAADGIGVSSGLTDDLLRRFGDSPAIVDFSWKADPGALAALAPDVVAAASDGDVVARALMVTGAQYIERALGALGWAPGEALCLIGGLGGAYADYLGDDLVHSLRAPMGNALDGALRLAGDAAGRGAS